MENYFVYILESQKDNRFYSGQTNNLEKRIQDHNKGYSKYTKSFRPWKLFAYKKCTTRKESMALEKKLKNLKSTVRMNEFIIKNDFRIV